MNKKFRANGRAFSRISEAKAEARRAMIGKDEEQYVLVYEWQATTGDLAPGYWEPVARAEYKRHRIVCK